MMKSLALIGTVSLAGCVTADDEIVEIVETGIVEQASTVPSATSLTGNVVVGAWGPGLAIDGTGQLVERRGRANRTGAGVIGLTLSGITADGGGAVGQRVRLVIEDAVQLGHDGPWAYRVSYSYNGDVWASLCGTPDNLALAIDGRWDYRAGVRGAGGPVDAPGELTFACRDAAIATCAELGYSPWSTPGAVSLRDHHTACVRMLRGDYCGDGQAWADGASLDIRDTLGLHDRDADGSLDAQWNTEGATCVDPARKLATEPSCFAELQARDCSHEPGRDALLVSSLGRPQIAIGGPHAPATTMGAGN